jgi:DNA polymerase III delta subunit
MIYILSGNDTKKKYTYIKTLAKNRERIFLPHSGVSKEVLYEYASNTSLFGESPIVLAENILTEHQSALSSDDLAFLKDSPTLFFFLEDKLLASNEKKYKKYATIEKYEERIVKEIPKTNPFALADAFARRDKVGAWILYRDEVNRGAEPEPMSGILFWKIKTMLLNGTKTFSVAELKQQSSTLVSLYHRAHRGECDFVIGLEQFILSSLSISK